MQYTLTNISWFAPRPADPSCVSFITSALNNDAKNAKVANPGVCFRV